MSDHPDLIARLRCLGSLLHQLNARTACDAVNEAIEELGSLRQVPDGYVLLPRKLTAENGAKGLLSGEFAEGFEMNCGECDSVDEDAAQHCDVCNGHGTYRVDTPVGWDTIKDIYRMIVDNLAVEANPAPPTSGKCKHNVCCLAKPTGITCADGECDIASGVRAEPTPAQAGAVCTCPSGDGSLRWPCPQHPPKEEWQPTPCPACGGFCGDHGPTCAEAAAEAQAGAELPELPEPAKRIRHWDGDCLMAYFTADQMRAYALEARRGG